MADLRLAVKREYFEAIKNGQKIEEYRLRNEYWDKRMLGKKYETVTITLGYPKACDQEKIVRFKYIGCILKTITHKHFGVDPVPVYAIRLEERI